MRSLLHDLAKNHSKQTQPQPQPSWGGVRASWQEQGALCSLSPPPQFGGLGFWGAPAAVGALLASVGGSGMSPCQPGHQ